jgi:hypothetical protein
MKIKLSKIINSVSTFKTLTQQTTNIRVAYKIAKILSVLQAELDIFEQTKFNLLQKYEEKDETGKPTISDANLEIIKAELNTLIEEEVEVDFQPIPILEVGQLNMTISNMMLIDFIFKD